jgi:CRP/FNR family cyclic AMP-dependent transcriptional regulator
MESLVMRILSNLKLSAAHRETIGGDPWFSSLPQPQRESLLGAAVLTHWRCGALVYHQGDPANAAGSAFYGLASGTIKLSTLREDGREAIFAVVEAGNWFGELSLIDGAPRTHNATALTPIDLLVVPSESFSTLLGDVIFSNAMTQLLATRIRLLFAFSEGSGLRPRIARRLLMIARADATQTLAPRRKVTLPQESLAMMLGITRQTLSRELNAMAQEGLIALGYGHIEINSFEALERCGNER